MEFTYDELALLNEMISVALSSGKIAYDENSKEIHRKISNEIFKRNQERNANAQRR